MVKIEIEGDAKIATLVTIRPGSFYDEPFMPIHVHIKKIYRCDEKSLYGDNFTITVENIEVTPEFVKVYDDSEYYIRIIRPARIKIEARIKGRFAIPGTVYKQKYIDELRTLKITIH